MKVLVSAYACSPGRGSEPGVGWGIVRALASRHELWVIVESQFQRDIERALAAEPALRRQLHFHFLPRTRHDALRRLWPPSYYWFYRRWHRDALQLAQRLHREVRFDLAHQLTMVGFREPGYLWRLGIPFAWGPIGGMGLFPWRFLPSVGLRGAVYFAGYDLFNELHMRFLTRPRRAARAAGAGLIAATQENARGAAERWGVEATIVSEIGLPSEPAAEPSRRLPGEPLRLVWSGRHVPGKALNLAIEAVSQLPVSVSWRLEILGDGPRSRAWRELAERRGVAGRCRFHGWLPREEALEVTRRGHVMVITSLRELTSTVTVEALALGLPVVCLDHCGFVDAVDATCGIRVPVRAPTESVRALAEAIGALAADEGLRSRLAAGALRRARAFSWDQKAEVIGGLYQARVDEARRAMAEAVLQGGTP